MTLSARDSLLGCRISARVCPRLPLTSNSVELTLPKERERLVGELVTAFPVAKAFNLGNAMETLAVHWLSLGQVGLVWPISCEQEGESEPLEYLCPLEPFSNDGNVLRCLASTVHAAGRMCLLNT